MNKITLPPHIDKAHQKVRALKLKPNQIKFGKQFTVEEKYISYINDDKK